MIRALVEDIQKFVNNPFFYSEFVAYLDKKQDLLLNKNVLEKSNEFEYNAIWDTMVDLNEHFKFTDNPSIIVVSRISVLSIYNHNLSLRKSNPQ